MVSVVPGLESSGPRALTPCDPARTGRPRLPAAWWSSPPSSRGGRRRRPGRGCCTSRPKYSSTTSGSSSSARRRKRGAGAWGRPRPLPPTRGSGARRSTAGRRTCRPAWLRPGPAAGLVSRALLRTRGLPTLRKSSGISAGGQLSTIHRSVGTGYWQGFGFVFIFSGSGSSVWGWRPIRIQGFNDQKLTKKLQLKKKYFFDQKLQFTYP